MFQNVYFRECVLLVSKCSFVVHKCKCSGSLPESTARTVQLSTASTLYLSLCRSVSMIDMRAEEEEETLLQPHSQVRHELMHNQYNKMKEEEDHWQDVSVSVLSSSLFWPSICFLFETHLNFFLYDTSHKIRTWPGGRTEGGVFLRISSKKRRRGRWWNSCCQERPAPLSGDEALRPTEK